MGDGVSSRVARLGASRFGYAGRARRTARTVQRLATYAASPRLYPAAPVLRAFWWEMTPNFGDALTPVLLSRYGVVAVHTPLERADVIGIGSLVQLLPEGFSGALWGCGQIYDAPVDQREATCIALRGELTRAHLGDPPVRALGDPGLLLRRLVQPTSKRFDVGIVAHYAPRDEPAIMGLGAGTGLRRTFVDVRRGPFQVARHIAACRAIITTSLHGLIMADAFGIPALWVRLPNGLHGGDFKFRDHESVARPARRRGVDIAEIADVHDALGRACAADTEAVELAVTRLEESIPALVEATPHRMSSPLALAPLHLR